MPVLPLGIGSYKRQAAFLPEVELRNLLLEKDETGLSPDKTVRVVRPGLTEITSAGNGPIRAIFQQPGVADGALFSVSGATLYREGASAGFVGGNGAVSIAGTAFGLFVSTGQSAAVYSSSALTNITMPNGREVVDLDQLSGYVVLGTPQGRFYWVEPGETTVDPLNFASAESAPDGLLAVRRVGDEIWLFGRTTVEPWQLTGDANAPFQRAVGRQYDRGCRSGATVRRFDNSVLWVGDDGVVYRGGSVPTRVSNHGIEERIRKASGELSAWLMQTDGHKLYVLDIPGQGSFAFDAASSVWSQFSDASGDTWQVWTGASSELGGYAGSRTDGRIFRVDADADADGADPVRWAVSGFAPMTARPVKVSSFSIGVGIAQDAPVMLEWADGQDGYGAPEELSAFAPYDVVNVYGLGMPRHPGRSFRISGFGRASVYGAMVNEAWQ